MCCHSHRKWLARSTIFVAIMACIATVQAAKLDEVFNGKMLGTTPRYFESVAGIPVKKVDDTYHFDIEGCEVRASIKDEAVYALRLELTPSRCQADLSSFGFNRSTRGLTFGYFTSGKYPEAQYALDPSFYADCLMLCGNAYDPSVYAFWEGPHTKNFIQVVLEVVQASGPALDAVDQWRESMLQQMGENYVVDLRFNCEDRFSYVAAQAFENVEVEAITIGHNLFSSSFLTTEYICEQYEQ